ncbi:MKI67 FHA domain-interacting nucleolar phosphoprotein-like [Ptiloglossa arizonensis]|uniref:MKI67 FHA domain-interacting nucleolar phosphoprotein-like n=1 Tax=Ptiloglossa arizonensis TaxID=3350558 RepID=UPI003F9EF3ED
MKIKKKSNAVRIPPLKRVIKIKRKSLDVEEKSTVSKALENVKKVLEKKTSDLIESSLPSKSSRPQKVNRRKNNKIKTRRRNPRGIVYLGHIPHGFYEEQMKDYFQQFGIVTRVRVVRSKNTGSNRGYGYIEFLHPEVAKVAAETMNNYLMCGRLLKATYIPPERQHPRFFVGKSWTKEIYPKVINRDNVNKVRNAELKKGKHASFIQSARSKLSALEKILKEKGHDIKFVPIDDVKLKQV